MRECNRRDFLRFGGQAGLLAGASSILPGCGAPLPYISSPTDSPTTTPARVAVSRGLDLYEMTRRLLDSVGGIGAYVQPGETVFIKPNFGGLGFVPHNIFTSGECCKVETVVTVAEECLKAGAGQVIIGEGGQVRTFSWADAVTLDGATNLAAEADRLRAAYPGEVILACLEADSPAWDPLPSPHTDLGNIEVSGLLARADRVISIAVLKTHRWTHLTGTMKNFVGTTSLDRYGSGFNARDGLHFAAGGVAQCFLDIVAGLQPDLAIIDGSIGCEGNGPHVFPMWGTTVDVKDRLGDWFLLAGTDLPALDATAARIIGLDVDYVPHLQQAYQQGLGQIREDLIELAGADLDDLRMPWQPADHTEGFGAVVLPTVILKMLGLW